MHTRKALAALFAFGAALSTLPAAAQTKALPKVPIKIKLPVPPGPDLRMQSAHVSKVWNCKESASVVYTVMVRVRNIGNQTAQVPRYKPMFLLRHKKDARWSATGNFSSTGSSGYRNIAAGATADAYFMVKRAADNPLVMKGASHDFELVLDPENHVKERSESNNRFNLRAPAVNACFTVF